MKIKYIIIEKIEHINAILLILLVSLLEKEKTDIRLAYVNCCITIHNIPIYNVITKNKFIYRLTLISLLVPTL